jgi:hypothetical protein
MKKRSLNATDATKDVKDSLVKVKTKKVYIKSHLK